MCEPLIVLDSNVKTADFPLYIFLHYFMCRVTGSNGDKQRPLKLFAIVLHFKDQTELSKMSFKAISQDLNLGNYHFNQEFLAFNCWGCCSVEPKRHVGPKYSRLTSVCWRFLIWWVIISKYTSLSSSWIQLTPHDQTSIKQQQFFFSLPQMFFL